jgi:serine/threonine protein kinase
VAAAPSDRNLLFGILALQMDFITRDALVGAMNAWVLEKSKPLGQILVDRGDLAPENRALLEPLVEAHVRRHGGDPRQSLAALSSVAPVQQALTLIPDPDLHASLAALRDEPPAPPVPGTLTLPPGAPDPFVTRFRILRPHAKGGLGQVYVARDSELGRTVALKEIQLRHADSTALRTRFVLEAEINGNLEHPGIVPVYGLGAYPDGRPYYAMRFVQGDSLRDAIERFHAESPNLSATDRALRLRQLLGRFVDICDAIAYAHSRGVLHRDLKPHNVMLGKYGETLVVDWGLAKPLGRVEGSSGDGDPTAEGALVPPSSGSREATVAGQALGTPGYMSPEQVQGMLDRLGPATDVYSLGATLYCLLTGRAPVTGDDYPAKVIRGDITPPRTINPSVPRALEAVCLKAMALRPEDRYPSARALADDVERWLADEPVSARRDPLFTRAWRWVRKHRTLTTTAAAVAVVGLAALSVAYQREARYSLELGDANLKLKQANEATGKALVQSEEARKRAEGVLSFLKDDVLAAARPENQAGGLGVAVTVRQAIDAAEPKIAERFKDQPLVEAEVRDTLGTTYLYLQEGAPAIRQHDRAMELRRTKLVPDHPDTLSSRRNLANAYHHAGRTSEAIALLEGTLKMYETKLGPDHPDTLMSRSDLATAYRTAGRTAEAITLHEATLKLLEAKLGPDHPDTLTSRNNLADAYRYAGRIADAIAMLRATLEVMETKLGPDHPLTLTSRNNLGDAYRQAGRTAEAIAMLRATLEVMETKLGPDNPGTLMSRSNLATAYRAAGRTAEAIALHETTLKLRETKLGPDHPDTLQSRNNLATAYDAAGRTAEAIALHETTLRRYESRLGPDHPNTLMSRNNLAATYDHAGRTAEAIALQESTLKLMETRLGPDHPNTLTSRNNLALAYRAAGRAAEAIRIFEAMLPAARKAFGPDHPNTLTLTNNIALAHETLGRWAEAEALRRDALARRRKTTKPDSPLLAGDLDGLGRNLLRHSKWSEAESLLRESLAIRVKALPDDWARFNTMSLLGGVLLGQGKFAEAEPLVVPGYEGMKARAAKIPAPNKRLLSESAERVVRLYEGWGKADKATEWKARLGLADLPNDVFRR